MYNLSQCWFNVQPSDSEFLSLPIIYGLLATQINSLRPAHIANVLLALATMGEHPTNLMLQLQKRLAADVSVELTNTASDSDPMTITSNPNLNVSTYSREDALTVVWALVALDATNSDCCKNIIAPMLHRFVVPSLSSRRELDLAQEDQLHQIGLSLFPGCESSEASITHLRDRVLRPVDELLSGGEALATNQHNIETEFVPVLRRVLDSENSNSNLGGQVRISSGSGRTLRVHERLRDICDGFYQADCCVEVEVMQPDVTAQPQSQRLRLVFNFVRRNTPLDLSTPLLSPMDPWQRLKKTHLESETNSLSQTSQTMSQQESESDCAPIKVVHIAEMIWDSLEGDEEKVEFLSDMIGATLFADTQGG